MTPLLKLGGKWRSRSLWAAVLLPAFFLAPGARASSSIFSDTGNVCTITAPCWQAGEFGLLVGVNQTVNFNSTGIAISGGIGVGGTTGTNSGKLIATADGQIWSGPIDFADGTAATSGNDPHCGTSTCSVASGSDISAVTLSGKVTELGDTVGVYYTPGATTALTDVMSVAKFWSSVSASSISGTLSLVTSTSLTTSNGQIKLGNTSAVETFVYDVKSINIDPTGTQKAGILIDALAGSLVIINDSGSASFSATGTGSFYVSLEGGITADDVLFNMTSLSSTLTISGTNASYLDADFIVAGGYDVSHATLDGRLLGWGTATSTFGTSFVLAAPPNVVPEPEDWLLLTGGLGLFGYLYGKQLRLNRNFPLGARVRERIEADGGEAGICVPAVAGRAAGADGPDGAPPSEAGIPPPRGGGGGGSGGVDLAREP